MADDELIDQSEIEQLLNKATPAGESEKPVGESQSPAAAEASAEPLGQGDIESLLGEGGESSGQQASPTSAPASAPAAATEDDDKLLGQDDIEKLLNQAGTTAPKSKPEPAAATQEVAVEAPAKEGAVLQGDVEFLLSQAERALESIDTAAADLPQGVAAFRLEEFSGAPASTENATLDLIRDVELDLKIELGRTHMYVEDVLKLRKGSVITLDKLAGDPVDIYVNGRLIARGEVLVLNDNFCVRVAELIAGANEYA